MNKGRSCSMNKGALPHRAQLLHEQRTQTRKALLAQLPLRSSPLCSSCRVLVAPSLSRHRHAISRSKITLALFGDGEKYLIIETRPLQQVIGVLGLRAG